MRNCIFLVGHTNLYLKCKYIFLRNKHLQCNTPPVVSNTDSYCIDYISIPSNDNLNVIIGDDQFT